MRILAGIGIVPANASGQQTRHASRLLTQTVSLDRNSGPVDQVLSTATVNRSRRVLYATANDAALDGLFTLD